MDEAEKLPHAKEREALERKARQLKGANQSIAMFADRSKRSPARPTQPMRPRFDERAAFFYFRK